LPSHGEELSLAIRQRVLAELSSVADDRIRRALPHLLAVDPAARVASGEDLQKALNGTRHLDGGRKRTAEPPVKRTPSDVVLRGQEVSFEYREPVTIYLADTAVTLRETADVFPEMEEAQQLVFPFVVLQGEAGGHQVDDAHGFARVANSTGFIILGRSNDRFSFPGTVSRRHAAIAAEDGRVTVSDLRSRGGTVVRLPSGAAGAAVPSRLAEELAESKPAGKARPARIREPDDPAEKSADKEAKPPGYEGGRLIALNMALNGTPRRETRLYLDENFEFSTHDVELILDEVYRRASPGDWRH